LHVGASIQLFPPSGEFTLTASEKPLVLISGGVGITPTLAMLEAALETERPVHFIHCARNGSVHAFRDWIDGLAARHPQLKRFYCYAEDDGVSPAADKVGLLSQEQLANGCRRSAMWMLTSSGRRASWGDQAAPQGLGVPEQQSRYEFFGPAAALE
jgi:nitric oxide dioxygenase